MMPRMNTQVSVNHPNTSVGGRSSKASTPTNRRTTASARLATATSMTFPMKYDATLSTSQAVMDGTLDGSGFNKLVVSFHKR